MYYYIFEPPRGKTADRQEKIKDILGDLGIAGETVSPSAARTIEELAHLGLMKGYSTIVAVGGEALTNRIINVLATEKIAKDVVLGIIPDDFNSILAKKIQVTDIRSACSTLKFRKLEEFDLCLIEPNKYFLTEASLDTFLNHHIYFAIDNLKGQLLTNRILIKPGLDVYIHDKSLEGGPQGFLLRWLFRKKTNDIYSSYFRTEKIRLESENPVSIRVGGDVVAKTPATIYNRSKVLKIIVSRDKIKNAK